MFNLIKKASTNFSQYLYTSVDERKDAESSKEPKFDAKSGPCHVEDCCTDNPKLDAQCGEPSLIRFPSENFKKADAKELQSANILSSDENLFDFMNNVSHDSENLSRVHAQELKSGNYSSILSNPKFGKRKSSKTLSFGTNSTMPLETRTIEHQMPRESSPAPRKVSRISYLSTKSRDVEQILNKEKKSHERGDEESESLQEKLPNEIADTKDSRTKPCRVDLCCALGHPGCKGHSPLITEETPLKSDLSVDSEHQSILKIQRHELKSMVVNDKIGKIGVEAEDQFEVPDKNSEFKEGKHRKIFSTDLLGEDRARAVEGLDFMQGVSNGESIKISGDSDQLHLFQKRSREFLNDHSSISNEPKSDYNHHVKEVPREYSGETSLSQNSRYPFEPQQFKSNQIYSTNDSVLADAAEFISNDVLEFSKKFVGNEIDSIESMLPGKSRPIGYSASTTQSSTSLAKKHKTKGDEDGSNKVSMSEVIEDVENDNLDSKKDETKHKEATLVNEEVIAVAEKKKRVCKCKKKKRGEALGEDEIKSMTIEEQEAYLQEQLNEKIKRDVSVQCLDYKQDDKSCIKCGPDCLLIPQCNDEEVQVDLSDDESVCSQNEDFMQQLLNETNEVRKSARQNESLARKLMIANIALLALLIGSVITTITLYVLTDLKLEETQEVLSKCESMLL